MTDTQTVKTKEEALKMAKLLRAQGAITVDLKITPVGYVITYHWSI